MRITVAEAQALLRVPGVRFSGADWKYGWPHKFYVGDAKVYNDDLAALDDAALAAWSATTEKFFGVTFFRDVPGGAVRWRCPFDASVHGYQRAGVVGPDGAPVRGDWWSIDFPAVGGG